MRSDTKMSWCPKLGAALSLALAWAASAQAQIVYEWVPDPGSGGTGTIVFDDAYMAANDDGQNILYTDPGNFITTFGNPPVMSIDFTFENGFSIDQAIGFDTALTIQNDLANTQFAAVNGEIEGILGGWSFTYTNAVVILPQTSYNGVSVDAIACITLPCPQGGAHFDFIGFEPGEVNNGRFVLVPEPATALALLAMGTATLNRRR